METIKIDFKKNVGKIRPMHSVNNGPVISRNMSNGEWFREANIPYARLHDSAFCSSYGGAHTVDISGVFPDFDKDPYDPKSYDFTLTDKYIADILAVGTKPFYRLGASIEHYVKKYYILPPRDFKKWAQICEGIIRHYTEGWADGFYYDMEYWEIWNEPDTGYKENNSPTWTGTMEQFFELFQITLKHLKEKFPHLKIGGPALCSVTDSIDIFEDMMKYLTKDGKKTPLDFFSWHMYGADPGEFERKIKLVDNMLKKYGYEETESILNEWNYVKDWSSMKENYNTIMSIKGAAYTAAAMCVCQRCGLDHLMYYDARPCAFNGMFRAYTLEPLKGYYPFWMFDKIYRLQNEAESLVNSDKLFACASQKEHHAAVMIVYFDDDDTAEAKDVKVDISGFYDKEGVVVSYILLDATHDCKVVRQESYSGVRLMPLIHMSNHSVVLLQLEKMCR